MSAAETCGCEDRAHVAKEMLARASALRTCSQEHRRLARERRLFAARAMARAGSAILRAIDATSPAMPVGGAPAQRARLAGRRYLVAPSMGGRVTSSDVGVSGLPPRMWAAGDDLLDRIHAIWLTLASCRNDADAELAAAMDEAMGMLDAVAGWMAMVAPGDQPRWLDDIREIDAFATAIHRSVHG